MNIAKELLNVTVFTSAGALTGMVAGPLGVTGGAIAGLFGSISGQTVGYIQYRAIANASNKTERESIQTTTQIVAFLALCGSVYAAASIVGIPITFVGVIWTLIVSVPIIVSIETVMDVVEKAFFPQTV